MNTEFISFTKLHTIKCNDFNEITWEDFFQKIRTEMYSNINDNYVEVRNGIYYIILGGKQYITKYANSVINNDLLVEGIIEPLKELVDLTIRLKHDQQEKEEAEIIKQNEHSRIVENAEKGIFENEEDVKVYIDHLKRNIKEVKKNIPSLLFEIFFDFTDWQELLAHAALLLVEIGVLIIMCNVGIPIPVVVGFGGLWKSVEFLTEGGDDLIECIGNIHKIKRKIKKLNKILDKSKSLGKTKKRINGTIDGKETETVLEFDDKNDRELEQRISKKLFSDDFKEIAAKIKKIRDKTKRDECFNALSEILEAYKGLIITKSSTPLEYESKISSMLVDLTFKVEEVLRRDASSFQDDFDTLMDEIEKMEKVEEETAKSTNR